jgi:hypothetical protein
VGAKKKRATKATAARQARVAAARVAGKTVTQIAKDEGVSRATASKEANAPEVQLLITSLVEAERIKIRDLFVKGLAVVDGSFSAERWGLDEDGTAVFIGPDHYARLTGVKCLTQLLTAGRQAVRPEPAARKTLSLDELSKLAMAGQQQLQ